MQGLEDALDSMSAREVERLLELAQRRLQRCAICNADGAVHFRVAGKTAQNSLTFALLICPSCVEKHRQPEGRADD
jgi:hypothetical protein